MFKIKAGMRTILTVLMLILVAACSQDPKEAVVGKWTEVGGTEQLVLKADGSVTLTDDGVNLEGTYTVFSAEKIDMQLSGLGELAGPLIMRGKLEGDQLTFETPDGNAHSYQKAK